MELHFNEKLHPSYTFTLLTTKGIFYTVKEIVIMMVLFCLIPEFEY